MLTLILTLTYHVSQSCHFKTLTLTLAHHPTPGNASEYIEKLFGESYDLIFRLSEIWTATSDKQLSQNDLQLCKNPLLLA